MNEDDTCLETYKHFFARDLLRNKVAFITGGGSGICFRIAEIFMRYRPLLGTFYVTESSA